VVNSTIYVVAIDYEEAVFVDEVAEFAGAVSIIVNSGSREGVASRVEPNVAEAGIINSGRRTTQCKDRKAAEESES
jgi:hypothetical protein